MYLFRISTASYDSYTYKKANNGLNRRNMHTDFTIGFSAGDVNGPQEITEPRATEEF